MKKTLCYWFYITMAMIVFLPGTIQAASTSGGIVLQQAVGARAQGMGETFSGIADDATALYWNVAGLSGNQGVQASATYFAGLADSTYEQLMYAQRLGKGGSLGIGLVFFQGGMMDLDQPDGSMTSVQSQSDMVLQVGYGAKLTKQLGVGVGLKMLNSTLIEEVSATAFAADLGAMLSVDEHLQVGLSLQNVGTEIQYAEEGDSMPTTVRLGAGYDAALGKRHAITLGLDLVKANDRDVNVHTGVEYWYNRLMALRLGYKAGYDLDGLTAGFGVKYRALQLDYAVSFMQELNNTHKVTLSMAL